MTRWRATRWFRQVATAAAGVVTVVAVGAVTAEPALAASPGPRDYVALGDSYASGLGTGAYDPNSGACKRSPYAYTRLWAQSHRVSSFRSVACAGAVTANVSGGQVAALDPGVEFVTISIGANDARFEHVMTACRSPLSNLPACLSAIDEGNRIIRTLLPARLDSTFRAIKARAPKAKVFVVGYARLFTETNFCGIFSMSNLVRHRLNLSADLLNSVLRARTASAGFRYVDTRTIFANHGLCSADPWINGVNILDIYESYHPNKAGHRNGLLRALTQVSG